jgi:hypothetical protein
MYVYTLRVKGGGGDPMAFSKIETSTHSTQHFLTKKKHYPFPLFFFFILQEKERKEKIFSMHALFTISTFFSLGYENLKCMVQNSDNKVIIICIANVY